MAKVVMIVPFCFADDRHKVAAIAAQQQGSQCRAVFLHAEHRAGPLTFLLCFCAPPPPRIPQTNPTTPGLSYPSLSHRDYTSACPHHGDPGCADFGATSQWESRLNGWPTGSLNAVLALRGSMTPLSIL